jgi:16S rRNA (cytosine1402-N4)-methyltransferase
MVAADLVGPAVLHTPVMAEQVVKMMFNSRASGTTCSAAQRRVFVDGTVGHGGHAEALLRADAGCAVLCIDADAAALATAKGRLAAAGFSEDGGRVSFYRGSYAELGSALAAAGRAGFAGSSASSGPLLADGVLLDLGLGSHQLDAAHRGFSFQRDGPLDMRIAAAASGAAAPAASASAAPSAAAASTAADIVSSWSAAQLTELLVVYGEEAPERAAAVARAIVHWRGKGDRLHRRITSTLELRFALEQGLAAVDGTPLEGTGGKLATKAVRWASRRRREKDLDAMERQRPRYPAETRTLFQALRIAVNAELAQLAGVLAAVPRHLAPGGRLVTLAFQPQEDAAIVAALNTLTTPGLCPSAAGTAALLLPAGAASGSAGRCPCGACGGAPFSSPLPADAPLRASPLEVRANPRARSARLRVLQRDCTCYGSAAAAGAADSTAVAAVGAAWLGEVEGALRSAVAAVLPAALKAGAARPKKAAGERVRSAPAAARSRAAAPSPAASAVEVPADAFRRVLAPAPAAFAAAAPADDVSDAELEAAIAASLAHGRRSASASAAVGRGRAGASAGLLMAPPGLAGGLCASVRLLHTAAAPAQQRRGGVAPAASQEEEESALAIDASAAALSEAEALSRGAGARSARHAPREAESSEESDGEAAPRARAAAVASEGGEDEEAAGARAELAALLAKAGYDIDKVEGLEGKVEGEGGEEEAAEDDGKDDPFEYYADGMDAPFMPPHPAQLLPLPPLRGFAGAPRLPALLPGVSAGLVEKLNFREDKPATLAAGHVVYAGKAAALNPGAAAVPLFDPASSVEALSAINPGAAATAGVHFGIDTLNRIGESVNFGVGREGRLAIAATIDRRLRAQSARRKATVLRLLRDQVMERGGISRHQGGRLTREQATSIAAFIWANEHAETDRAVAYVHPHRPASVAAAARVPPAVPAMPPPSSASAAGLVAGAGAKVPALLSAFEGRFKEIKEATRAARRRLNTQRRAAEWSARQRARWAERDGEELR